MDMIDVVVM